jgi:hypothetical protein
MEHFETFYMAAKAQGRFPCCLPLLRVAFSPRSFQRDDMMHVNHSPVARVVQDSNVY